MPAARRTSFKRTHHTMVRLSAQELRDLRALARQEGVPMSALLRQLILRAKRGEMKAA